MCPYWFGWIPPPVKSANCQSRKASGSPKKNRLRRLLAAHSISIPKLALEPPPPVKAVEPAPPVDKEERAIKRVTLFRSPVD
jgi:hypothetical protein